MRSIYGLSLNDLETYLTENGMKAFHGKQIFRWLYHKRVKSFDEMSDISKKMIEKLKEDFELSELSVVSMQTSKDGTKKFLFEMNDGSLVESVLMVFDYGFSACLSSQVGCNMGCNFCASGLLKKQRDLRADEIVSQALMIQRELDKSEERLGNIVVMGTGEPFDNYDNVMKAMSIINEPLGLEIGARHISISTCGVVPGIKRFAKENLQYNLAISLHAPNDELRNTLMPINKAYPLETLFAALKEYCQLNNRRLTFEYLLLKGVNDSPNEANQIAELLKGMNAYINLIPYNKVDEKDYETSSDENALRFYDLLKKRNVAVTLRQKKGDDIDAACGQLRAKTL
ncbi:MAG: 23S rRNA (adenine(2503)-C(2))-methyltransferase RlmN, partial [Erysipelotrichaceae bacterium]|nr:23S rRNA (adenine(2503)-C(2))-methyltransferase RlmN [Erysipelotrichaceae bacterium]